MAAKRRTGLDKQSSALPIILGALAVAAVLGLIGGVVWGMSSSGGNTGTPTPLPSQSSPSASPTTASPTPTPTVTTPSPTPTPTVTTPTPTPTTASPTPTTPSGVPAWPGHEVLDSNNWFLNKYTIQSVNGKFGMAAYVANSASTQRSATFYVYLYVSGKYVGTLSASIGLTAPTTSGPGTPINFTSVYPYQSGAKVVFTAQ